MGSELFVTLHRALLVLLATAVVAALVPAGIVLEGRLRADLLESAREDLAMTLEVVADHETQRAAMLTMHAKELARVPEVAGALAAGRLGRARAAIIAAAATLDESPLLVTAAGDVLVGPAPDAAHVAATQGGTASVVVMSDSVGLRRVALAPITLDGHWLGAAGVTSTLDRTEAGMLAQLTRSGVIILTSRGTVGATTVPDDDTSGLVAAMPDLSSGDVRAATVNGRHYLGVVYPLEAGAVVLVRDLAQELAVLGRVRRVALGSGLLALGFALLVSIVAARGLERPVDALAKAADRLAAGDFEAPIERGGVREVRRLAEAFSAMRTALAARLADLEAANREAGERQERLNTLQVELMQRERLAATGRLVTQVAHEIRNPIASIRNCLELVHRRVVEDPEAGRFLDLAVEELLRMHKLTEQILDLSRPREPAAALCEPRAVAAEVAALVGAGSERTGIELVVHGTTGRAAMPPDALKQILLSLVQNASEAMDGQGRIEIRLSRLHGRAVIDVLDEGPGIPDDIRPRVFDPFFTTKAETHGVGLGLFVAEGVVRSAGGRLEAANRDDGPGARFRVEVPMADGPPPEDAG